MTWGIHNEFRGVAAAEAELGHFFSDTGDGQKTQFLTIGDVGKHFQLRATPDGTACVNEHSQVRWRGLEVKCPEKLHDEVRPYIVCQTQIQAYVCGLDQVVVVEWTFEGYRGWMVKHNPEYVAAAMVPLAEFAGYLRNDEEPPRLSKRPVMPEVETELIFESLQGIDPQEDNPF